MVSPALPTAADAIIEVQSWISDLGVRKAFKIVGRVLLYSGPRESIAAAFPRSKRNHPRALVTAGAKKRKHTVTGISGAPVFDNTQNRLCGMVVRGDLKNGAAKIWYIEIIHIIKTLEAIVSGTTKVSYTFIPNG